MTTAELLAVLNSTVNMDPLVLVVSYILFRMDKRLSRIEDIVADYALRFPSPKSQIHVLRNHREKERVVEDDR